MSPGDPRIGMVGASYGGGIQLVAAATDPRIDAIVPTIAWNTLNDVAVPEQWRSRAAWEPCLALPCLVTFARAEPGGSARRDLSAT